MIELARNDAQKGVQGVMAGIARRAERRGYANEYRKRWKCHFVDYRF